MYLLNILLKTDKCRVNINLDSKIINIDGMLNVSFYEDLTSLFKSLSLDCDLYTVHSNITFSIIFQDTKIYRYDIKIINQSIVEESLIDNTGKDLLVIKNSLPIATKRFFKTNLILSDNYEYSVIYKNKLNLVFSCDLMKNLIKGFKIIDPNIDNSLEYSLLSDKNKSIMVHLLKKLFTDLKIDSISENGDIIYLRYSNNKVEPMELDRLGNGFNYLFKVLPTIITSTNSDIIVDLSYRPLHPLLKKEFYKIIQSQLISFYDFNAPESSKIVIEMA